MTHDVFISHSIEDAEVADAVCAALEARGFACRQATREEGGEPAVAGSRAAILILSARSAGASSVLSEAQAARRHGVPVILVRIDDVAPSPALEPLLEGADRFDALTPPLAPHLDYLGDRLALLVGPGRQLTEPPRPLERAPRARAWLPIVAAGLAGLAAIALAAMVTGR
jgi:hypothetical protein